MATILIGRVLTSTSDSVRADQGVPAAASAAWPVLNQAQLVPAAFDFVALGYNAQGQISQALYRLGGPSGTLVATLNLTYVGGALATVTRS